MGPAVHKTEKPGLYTLTQPENALPLVFDSPHSGTAYPADFGYACDFAVLQKAEDKYVDQLFSGAPSVGAAFLCADFPRSYIDVNRCETDIDAELLEGVWPEESNPSPRSHAGIGLIRRLVRPGIPVYDRHLSVEEVRQRIESCYRPYHAALEELIDGAHYRFGSVWHINCHSMPSPSPLGLTRRMPLHPPDFVLGDRDGTTCAIDFTHAVRDFLKGLGYRVTINDPYKGVELVSRYSNPAAGRHSLQIEIARALYMDEDTLQKSRNFKPLQGDVEKLCAFCADYVQSRLMPMAAD